MRHFLVSFPGEVEAASGRIEREDRERANRAEGDPEVGICHICEREFPTQEELSKHLMDDHEGETLADAEGDAQNA